MPAPTDLHDYNNNDTIMIMIIIIIIIIAAKHVAKITETDSVEY